MILLHRGSCCSASIFQSAFSSVDDDEDSVDTSSVAHRSVEPGVNLTQFGQETDLPYLIYPLLCSKICTQLANRDPLQ